MATRISAGQVAGWDSDCEGLARAQVIVDRYYAANPPSIDSDAILTALRGVYEDGGDGEAVDLVSLALEVESAATED